jgi:predicted O-methyltransferase YrrM
MEKFIYKRLLDLEKSSSEYWNVPPIVGKYLNMMVKIRKAKNILELGTSNGYSTIWLALAARENNAHILSIEYYQERIDMATENFQCCKLDQYIKTRQGIILEILPEIKQKFDFIFIDASKEEYLDYIKLCEPLMEKNCVIIADNINSHRDKLEKFIQYMEDHPAFETVILNFGEGLLLSYKK